VTEFTAVLAAVTLAIGFAPTGMATATAQLIACKDNEVSYRLLS